MDEPLNNPNITTEESSTSSSNSQRETHSFSNPTDDHQDKNKKKIEESSTGSSNSQNETHLLYGHDAIEYAQDKKGIDEYDQMLINTGKVKEEEVESRNDRKTSYDRNEAPYGWIPPKEEPEPPAENDYTTLPLNAALKKIVHSLGTYRDILKTFSKHAHSTPTLADDYIADLLSDKNMQESITHSGRELDTVIFDMLKNIDPTPEPPVKFSDSMNSIQQMNQKMKNLMSSDLIDTAADKNIDHLNQLLAKGNPNYASSLEPQPSGPSLSF